MSDRKRRGPKGSRRPPAPRAKYPPKRVSISFVLADLEEAVDGASRLLESIEADLYQGADLPAVCRATRAVLGLVVDRLRLVQLAVIGERDPGLLHSRRTEALEAVPGISPGADLVLEAERS